jgi:hypothetical protein
MKKLLLYMALLMPAFSIHAMNQEKLSLSDILKPMEKFPNIFLRPLFGLNPANTENANSDSNNNNNVSKDEQDIDPLSAIEQETELASEPHNNNNSSFMSTDGGWHEVTYQEAKHAQLSNHAAGKLLEVRKVVPPHLQDLICPNLLNVENQIAEMDKTRELFFRYLSTLTDDYASGYTEMLNNNFIKCPGFNYKDVYTCLGFQSAQDGMNQTNEICAQRIKERLTTDNENEKMLMRQIGVFFRDELTKREFDAYLRFGEEGLKNPALNAEKIEELKDGVFFELVAAKTELSAFEKQDKKK